MIFEWIIDWFLLQRSQEKSYEGVYDLKKKILSELVFPWFITLGRLKLGYFSAMKSFRFYAICKSNF